MLEHEVVNQSGDGLAQPTPAVLKVVGCGGGGSSAIGKQGRLHITLCNKEDEFQEVKENFETNSQADTNKRSLVDFYRELPEGQEGTDLGMYYLSYLDDACKKVNVKFESLVNQFTASGLTVINLIFNF